MMATRKQRRGSFRPVLVSGVFHKEPPGSARVASRGHQEARIMAETVASRGTGFSGAVTASGRVAGTTSVSIKLSNPDTMEGHATRLPAHFHLCSRHARHFLRRTLGFSMIFKVKAWPPTGPHPCRYTWEPGAEYPKVPTSRAHDRPRR